ncbi:MAG: sugar ABC transporter ATP-binding protein [Methylobacteriaceae bacterium]|nr:sugar ABC transporter ATP-binding protein [Methylobacteriaceae bacterium]
MAHTPGESPLLRVEGLGKTYAVPVLEDVSLEFFPGEILALAGENGAGKSTLSRIIGGLLAPTAGRMELAGEPYAPAGRRQAESAGIRMVLQELSLIPTLSIAENLFIDDLPHRFGLLDRAALNARAAPLMKRVGLERLDPGTPVGDLGIGQQQMVEIARGLIGECRLLIFDEPSAMLSDRETDLLFAQIRELRERGVSIVFISHRLDEIKKISDRVSILRDGRLVTVQPSADMEIDDIVRAMVGRDVESELDFGARTVGGPVLEGQHLSRGARVRDVSFQLRKGEILGFAGLVGSGRTELMRLLFGADHPDSGSILLNGAPFVPDSPRRAVQAGIAMITEDRKGQGLLLPLSIGINTTLADIASISRGGWVDTRAEETAAETFIRKLAIRCLGPAQPVDELSGGNQQKVVLARWLYRDCDILLLDEPTRGIDIGARYEIYALMGDLLRDGKSLIVISSDLRELMLVCDRICVMSAGRLAAVFERGAWDQDAILTAAFSGHIHQTSQEH